MNSTRVTDTRGIDLQEKVAVVGLGYVGLPLATAFSRIMKVLGFDVDNDKIERLQKNGTIPVGAAAAMEQGADGPTSADSFPRPVLLSGSAVMAPYPQIQFTYDSAELTAARYYIIAVPTPVKSGNVPDLSHLKSASRIVGRALRPGALVVYESTVYPGVTEEVCIPLLEAESGLLCGKDFKVGYSPERINPGDSVHRLENIVKIVSGVDDESAELTAQLYSLVVETGVHRAESIRIAEAAKVIENAQRDINIAFMNELSMLFHQMGIDTQAVLRAARTKWNFLPFTPGLVGGHCIGIDPYYLTYKAEDSGFRSRLILEGRHINDGMGKYVAEQLIKLLVQAKLSIHQIRIAILGVTYKENCPDIRNSKVWDIVRELQDYGLTLIMVDPQADKAQVYREYGVTLTDLADLSNVNVVVAAVPHAPFLALGPAEYNRLFAADQPRIMMDLKGVYNKMQFQNQGYTYWSL